MPSSWYQATSLLMEKIMIENPHSVLDVGVGFGKYGILLREALDIPHERYRKDQWLVRIDGIEAFEGYRNPIHDYVYDAVYYKPVSECLPSLGVYDVVLMIDVLEHFTKEEGAKLLECLLMHTKKALIISTPINPAPQEEYAGNHYEAHLSRWTPVDFTKFEFDFTMLPIMGNKALIVKLYPKQETHPNNANNYFLDMKVLNSIAPVRKDDEKLHIAYTLPHQFLTGGLKMLIAQMRWLKSRGHTVDVYLQSSSAEGSALPSWMPAEVDHDVIIREGQPLHKHIRPCDVIVSGWHSQLPDLLASGIPVVYWEQGHEPLFGDLRGANLTPQLRNWYQMIYSLPAVFASVSDFVANIMYERYGRKTYVIPNGIDTNNFSPATKNGEDMVILLVGNPYLPFKALLTALSVLGRLWGAGHRFQVKWICHHKPNVSSLPFHVEIVHNPPQEALARLYAAADILLFTSLYEGFGMPPLEAMASGLCVVCTDCGGIKMYAVNEQNSLVVQPENENAMLIALERLMVDEKLREKISANGRKTALDFSFDKSLSKLEDLLRAVKKI